MARNGVPSQGRFVPSQTSRGCICTHRLATNCQVSEVTLTLFLVKKGLYQTVNLPAAPTGVRIPPDPLSVVVEESQTATPSGVQWCYGTNADLSWRWRTGATRPCGPGNRGIALRAGLTCRAEHLRRENQGRVAPGPRGERPEIPRLADDGRGLRRYAVDRSSMLHILSSMRGDGPPGSLHS